tara:strand:- start:23844 stop:25148 length:1305 start_codon:yes stop_codon:yes gene_type:complete
MLNFNPSIFYKRHCKEIEKYIFKDNKVLHIQPKDKNLKLKAKNITNLFVDSPAFFDSLSKSDSDFDIIVITDFIEEVDDLGNFFGILNSKLSARGKLLITSINNLWYPLLDAFELLNLKKVSKKRNHPTKKNFINILSNNSFHFISYHTRQFFPFNFFKIGNLVNAILEITLNKLNLGIKTYFLFQKNINTSLNLSKTIIIPAKNEEKNLEPLIKRIPKFEKLEIIIACGDSKDNTVEVAHDIKNKYKLIDIKVFSQSDNGKANAVFEAIEMSSNELIAILDADISVDPETLTNFFGILENGEADFVNGTRFVYRMENKAMRLFNVIGNKAFQKLISFVISRNLTDSLCGTKVFRMELKEKILQWQEINRSKDPFGDFDLLFSAAYSGQSILEYPIHYRRRVYGKTQISRFRDGWKLILYFINTLKNFTTSINN